MDAPSGIFLTVVDKQTLSGISLKKVKDVSEKEPVLSISERVREP